MQADCITARTNRIAMQAGLILLEFVIVLALVVPILALLVGLQARSLAHFNQQEQRYTEREKTLHDSPLICLQRESSAIGSTMACHTKANPDLDYHYFKSGNKK